jgi:hypothetical protein
VQVWIVHIQHKYGDDFELFSSEEMAESFLHQYVAEWWDDTGPGSDIEFENDVSVDISNYFGDNSREGYEIACRTVRTEADLLAEKALR